MAATPNNNFNILPWYTSLEKLNSKKWYAFGQTWPLICPNDSILPFQFVVPGVITSVSTITLITPDNIVTNTSVQPVIIANEKAGYSVIMVHPGITSLGTTLKIGQYRAQLVIGLDTFYSEMFTVVNNISDYIKLTYWNDENLYYNGGEVNYSNNFKYTMYICSTIGKPEYEFEEELTKRAGYKFLESQTSNKIYKFNFVAPEFICDAMRLIRLSDYIKLEYDGDSYNALSFSYEPKWETQGDLASVDVEFDTDAIIQKLVSFNRRQKEGFYNALLTNIDEPLLFDVNTVALYYDKYRANAAAEIRDGKMIRDLSEISLVNENTLIVVDTGSGPAYKMSLYRLMEKFMRRDKDETTEFDFWIKGDAKFGRDNYDNPTASISRDGLFRTVSAIIYDYLSSEKFISGFAGEGFKIYKDEFGNWRIECDILDVRKVMNVFELIIQKIRSVNGALVISQANGKVSAVTESPDLQSWILEFEDKDETFQAHDLVRCQVFDRIIKQAPAFDFTKFAAYLYDGTQIDDSVSITNTNVEDTTSKKGKYYWCEVASVNGNLVTIPKSEFEGVMPAVGDEVVQMGNTENPLRQSLIYMSAAEDGKPKIELVGGVKTKSLTGTSRSVFGNLDHITDPSFPDNMQPHGEGVYTDNGYFKGAFVFFNGKNAQTEIEKAQTDASNAQAEAEAAKERLNKWASDGFISPSEKQQLLLEKRTITAEKSEINADANRYNVNTVSYNSAYEAYISQINQHTATEPENIPVGPNLIPCQIDYYNNRTLILNEIAKAVKSKTDYLETEVSAIPGKITLAVRSLKVADVNLLKSGYKELRNDSYAIGYYPYDVPVINGKEYTLTVCYTLSANNTHIEAYANGGTNFLANFTTKGDKVIESKKVTMAGYKPAEGLYFYQLPSGTYGSKVHWAVLTDGNLGVTSWIPSASEKNVGLKNLCSFKRITDAGFTYAQRYNDDGTILISHDLLHNESLVANKDMFGLTYDWNKRYYIFIDHFVLPGTLPTDQRSTFLRVIYTDGSTSEISVYNDMVENRYLLTDKPISRILGSYGTFTSTSLRIGIYETNFPVSWSPAPEDQFYQSVKYTDTQISAVDGKIELSVTTKVNQIGVGGDNLVRYYSDTLISYYLYSSTPIVKDGYAFETTWNSSNTAGVLAVSNQRLDQPIGKSEILNFCYRFRMLINGVPATEDRIADKRLTTYAASGEMYYDGNGNFYGFVKGNTSGWFIHTPTTGMKGGDVIRIENFIAAKGTVCPGFSPASEDISFLNERFTQSKIDIVEGKITSTVEQINAVDGKVTGLASRVTQTESSINSVVGDINTLNNTTERKVTKRIDLTGWDNNKFYPLVIGIQQSYKNKIVINRPLDGNYGTPSYGTHPGGFSMNLTFEMSGSGWGSSPVITNIFDYYKSWTAAGAKIVVDLGQITESSGCVMGIRGGSKYDVTLYNATDPNRINVFNADYTGPYGQVFPVRTDGTEPVRTYGYYTEIKQLEHEISLKATKTEVTNSINSLSGRIEAAEIKLRPDNIALTVKEQGIGYSGTNYFGWGGGMTRDITGTNVYVTENKGTYGLQIACVNASTNILARYLGLGMNFKGPGKYTLSFKAKQQAGTAMELNINVCDAENFIITPPTTWQYYKKTFTVTQYTGSPYYGFIDFERSGGNITQIIEFAEIMLEYGSEATQWRPAPFDTTAASGLLATGINISNGQIVLTADKTKFQNNSGSQIAVFDSNGINADLINAKKLSTAVAGKRIVIDPSAQEIQLYNEYGHKVGVFGFQTQSGISYPFIQMKDYNSSGAVVRQLEIVNGTIYANNMPTSTNLGLTLNPITGLQFTRNGVVTKTYPVS